MISGTLPPYKCGVGDYTYQLAKHLSYSGLEVDILTSCGASEFDGCNVYGNVESWNRLKTLGEILNIYKRKNYDIVHIQFPTAAYGKRIIACMVVPMLKSMGVKVVVTIHEYTGGSFRYKAELWPSLLCADKIIIVEPKFKNDIKKLPIPSSKINFINIGANVSRSGNNLKVLEAIRDRVLGEKRDYRIVSTFGFISPGKLTIEILWALRYLKGIDKLKTKLLIVGDLQENDTYQKEVLQYIKDNCLENDVYITGFLPMNEVGNYLAASDYACTLFKNGVSIRNGSFLACVQEGIPVITTKSDTVLQGFNNIIYLNNVRAELWKEMLKLQENWIIEKTIKSKNRRLEWDNIAKRHVKLYKTLCRG